MRAWMFLVCGTLLLPACGGSEFGTTAERASGAQGADAASAGMGGGSSGGGTSVGGRGGTGARSSEGGSGAVRGEGGSAGHGGSAGGAGGAGGEAGTGMDASAGGQGGSGGMAGTGAVAGGGTAGAGAVAGGGTAGDGGKGGTDVDAGRIECNEAEDCAVCVYETAPSSDGDCYCPFCPVYPMSKTECQANTEAWNTHCSDWMLTTPCPVPICLPPSPVSCNMGVCETTESSPVN